MLSGGILITGASAAGGSNGAPQIRSLADPGSLEGATESDLAGVMQAACGGCEPTVDIYKAPAKGMTQKILQDGFTEEDFPGSGTGFPDGRAYFGLGERGNTIALDYASRGGYDGTVIRIRIPQADFDAPFSSYVYSYDGIPNAEVAIPNTSFWQLNQYKPEVVYPEEPVQ